VVALEGSEARSAEEAARRAAVPQQALVQAQQVQLALVEVPVVQDVPEAVVDAVIA
jgi:hypothetical protein